MRKTCLLLSLVLLVFPLTLLGQATVYHFKADLSPAKEVPAVTDTQTAGTADVLMKGYRDDAGALIKAIVEFNLDVYAGVEEEFIGLHIHENAEGANGPIVIRSGLDFDTASQMGGPGMVKIWRQMVVEDAETLAAVDRVIASPSGFYVNLHATSHPPGIVRGQLRMSEAAMIQAVSNQVNALDALVREVAFLLGLGPRLRN